jgi:hypothetical protein
MEKTIYFCDLCDNEANEFHYIEILIDGIYPEGKKLKKINLCEKHYFEIKKILQSTEKGKELRLNISEEQLSKERVTYHCLYRK